MGFNDGARNLTPRLSVVKVEPSSTDADIPENVVQAPVSSHKNRKEDLGEDTRQKVSQIQSTLQSMNNNHHASTTTEKPRGVKPDPSRPPQKKENIAPSSIPKSTSEAEPKPPSSRTCPICSFANEPTCITCTICANVLDPKNVVGSWACISQTCLGSQYRNAGDCGVCGVCGERKRGGTR